jgi:sodium/potassium-transporting ATPase subunit alpha
MELEEYISDTTEYVSIRDQSQTDIHFPLIENKENSAISSSSARNQDALQAIDYHLISEKELFIRYGTERKAGISSDEAQRRLKRDGPNVVMPKRNILGIILKYVSPFFFGFGFIFWPAVILSILSYKPLGNPHHNVVYLIQAGIFVFVIMANGLVIIMQEFASNQLMNSIAKMLPSTAKLIRNGNNVKIDIEDIVVGDIVQLNVGDIVPADMRLIEISGLKLDTSMLTGESNHMLCNVHSVDSNIMETKNVAFMGTKCVEGHAIGVVTNTGNRTIMGSITRNVSKEKEANSMSSLKNEVNRFVIIIAFISILIGLGFLFVWGIWLKTKHPGFISASEMIAISLAAGIAIIPDALPLFFVILLSLITYKMARKKIVVKHLMTAENLGSVNVICSDKTGTLTQNRYVLLNI